MSILYLFIFLIVVILLIKDFDRTIIYYAPFKLVLHSGIRLYDASFAINLDMAISFAALILFILKASEYRSTHLPKFIVVGGLVFCFGYFIHGMNPRFAFNVFFYEPITTISFMYILFKVVRSEGQLSSLIKGFIIVGAILIVDAVVDVIFNFNVITEIEKSQGGGRLWISDNDTSRTGIARTTSFMPHSIAMGTIAVFIWAIVVVVLFNFPRFIKVKKPMLYFILVGLPLCMLYANSRTTILTAICFTPLFLKKNLFFSKMGFALLIAVIVLVIVNNTYFEWVYNSIFNEKTTTITGSSYDLREKQFEIAMFYFLQNPLTGKGVDFDVLKYANQFDAMGMESEWFTLLMLRGLVGVVTYLYLIITGLISFFKYNRIFWMFTFAWLVNITFSSQEGLSMFLYCIFILLCYKIHIFESNTLLKYSKRIKYGKRI